MSTPACLVCGSKSTRKHCDGRAGRCATQQCTWWFCNRCRSFGDTTRYVNPRKR